ncbi:MAG: DUF2330 domain-containing protein [Myxococcota bacterium]
MNRWMTLALLGFSPLVSADPCGMVPPIQISQGPPPTIERTGAQRTYVFHRDGVETVALRPGFTGSVEEFGMLIPFPAPPALRKIDDMTFHHMENAIDPPIINVEIYDPRLVYDYLEAVPAGRAYTADVELDDAMAEQPLRYNEVRVLNEEAVGMYQVAVLAAGSAKALQRWMDKHGYRYPDGMDTVTNDYVADGWCFVAIKAKVGAAPGVSPRPGMRNADPSLPTGASFDGHVQGMAFRFPAEEPVVPMRLSVFNGEDPRNVVYMLSEKPVRINNMDKSLVVRQLSGKELYDNLTEPLEINYINGQRRDLAEHNLQQLDQMGNAEPYIKVARDLIASDLLAVREQTLSLPYEEMEKELLAISESFDLRGADIDALHRGIIDEALSIAVDGALGDLREMHMTVIDGVFPQDVLARENLTFTRYVMPEATNVARADAIAAPDMYVSMVRK